ncbi:hypothetical protein MAR_020354, partial [Mya arenaria]
NKGRKWHISQEADLPRWKTRIRAARLNCLTDLNPSNVKGITVTHPNTTCPVQKNQYMNVEKPLNNPKTHTQLAICSKIAFHELNASHLLEWIEVHRLLGADLIVSYTYNLNEKALAVLKYYEKIGFVKLLSFDLPEKDIDLLLRTIPLFDCQNRLAGYKYYALLDTDEFLIPNTSDFKNAIKTYMTDIIVLLQDKQLTKLPKLAGFHFQTKIHALNWKESDSSSPLMIKRFSNSTPAFADRVKKLYFPNRVIVDRMLTHSLHAKPGFV